MLDDHLVTNALILLTVFTVLASIARNPNCSLALLFSLVTARLFTAGGDPHLHFNIMIFFAAICIFNVKDGRFEPLVMKDNEVNYAVGYLYILRMIAGFLCARGVLGVEPTWIISSSMLLIQNLLVLREVLDGRSPSINDTITRLRYRAGSLVFPSTRL